MSECRNRPPSEAEIRFVLLKIKRADLDIADVQLLDDVHHPIVITIILVLEADRSAAALNERDEHGRIEGVPAHEDTLNANLNYIIQREQARQTQRRSLWKKAVIPASVVSVGQNFVPGRR